MPVPTIEPTLQDSLGEVCDFLHCHLNPMISPENWQRAFTVGWYPASPNYGFHVRNAEGNVVGAIGAIYSQQRINGQDEFFCNITSWCVLEEYRNQSMSLAMSVSSQTGFHFTDLSPSDDVVRASKILGFKTLETDRKIIFNVPSFAVTSRPIKTLVEPAEIEQSLPASTAQIYADHKGFAWIDFFAVGVPGDYCLIAYKSQKIRHLPSATILYVSNPGLFTRYIGAIRNWFLLHQGFITSTIETRFVDKSIGFSIDREQGQTRMFKSSTLDNIDITNLYSELFCMDL